MTSTLILETLASEFSTEIESVRCVLEMLEGGLSPAHIGRHRRADSGAVPEHVVRRMARRHAELLELDRRRASIRRMLESTEGVPDKALAELDRTADRFALEDLFLPYRKPEPEVQLALDRGLGALADRLVAPTDRRDAPPVGETADAERADGDRSTARRTAGEGSPVPLEATTGGGAGDASAPSADAPAPAGSEATAAGGEPEGAATDAAPDSGSTTDGPAPAADEASSESGPSAAAGAEADPADGSTTEGDTTEGDTSHGDTTEGDTTDGGPTDRADEGATAAVSDDDAPAGPATGEPTASEVSSATAEPASEPAPEAGAGEGATPQAPASEAPASEAPAGEAPGGGEDRTRPGSARGAKERPAEGARPHAPHVTWTPELKAACAEFVVPDRGVHTEQEALTGAMRILADRLGRSSSLRGQLRKQLRRHGVLDVQPGPNPEKAGRHKALFKIEQPMKQIQGTRLIAIRQAQRDRAVTTVIKLDRRKSLATVRKALARRNAPEFDAVLDAVTEVALDQRLLPMLEADVRLELKERSDAEALRFLTAHLREVLLTPPLGPRPVAGVDISPKQDWTLVVLDAEGRPAGPEVKLETAGKDDVTLGEELAAVMRDTGVEWLACSHNRSVRPAVRRLRKVVALTGSGANVALVNETGVAGWVNSEAGRRELGDLGVQGRGAVVLGRRLQDPLAELLKLDPRQLGLGVEKSLVSKANLRRAIDETVESCVALVGVDVNEGPEHLLRRVPGLDAEAVAKILAARAETPFASREELRERGVLDGTQWQNAIGFLRVRASDARLDHSGLHPDQYPLAMRLVEATGESADHVIGRFGGLKGLRRADFDVDEHTWRDLQREIGHPGRDPRPRIFPPKMLDPDTDPATLEKDQVVEGFVGNVANFGAFVDLGLEREGFVHISALADRFVRDARELTSIGRPVRAKVVEVGSSRIGLTLVGVPDRERPPRGDRRGPRRGEGRRGRDGGRDGGRWQEPERMNRVARVRRDGMPGDDDRGGRGPRRGGPGGRPGGRGDRRPRREGAGDAAAFTKGGAKDAPKNNPFAKFFDKDGDGGGS